MAALRDKPFMSGDKEVEIDTLEVVLEQAPDELYEVRLSVRDDSTLNLFDTTGTESWDDTEKLIYYQEVRSLNSVDTGKYTMATNDEGGDNKEFIIRLAKYSTVKGRSNLARHTA